MSEPFVPFAKTRSKPGSAGDSFRLTILPQAQQAAPFQPVATAPSPAGNQLSPKEPQVTLEREGDRITRIKIQCVCGQVLELDCAY
jgi:hypothetical protein